MTSHKILDDLFLIDAISSLIPIFSRASTPDFSQISLGDTRWCDGLNFDGMTHEGHESRGMVAALALADSSIQIVNWRDEENE